MKSGRSSHPWLAVFLGGLFSLPAFAQPPVNPTQARLDQTISGLDGPVLAVAQNEEAGILAAACERGVVRYWHKDVMTGVRVGDGTPLELRGHRGPVLALAWAGKHLLASAGADQQVLLWEMPEGKQRPPLSVGVAIRALAASPDGKLLAGGGDDGAVQLWETATGKPTSKLAGTDWMLALAFSPDGRLLASSGYDGMVRLWEVGTGKKVLEFPAKPPAQPNTPPGPANSVQALAFSPDGKLLAVGGSDAQIHLANAADGKIARSIPGHASSITALAFHPSGALLVSGSKDRTVCLWNPASGQAIKTLEGHTAWVQGVTFLVQGTRLASVSADQTMRLWELTEPKK